MHHPPALAATRRQTSGPGARGSRTGQPYKKPQQRVQYEPHQHPSQRSPPSPLRRVRGATAPTTAPTWTWALGIPVAVVAVVVRLPLLATDTHGNPTRIHAAMWPGFMAVGFFPFRLTMTGTDDVADSCLTSRYREFYHLESLAHLQRIGPGGMCPLHELALLRRRRRLHQPNINGVTSFVHFILHSSLNILRDHNYTTTNNNLVILLRRIRDQPHRQLLRRRKRRRQLRRPVRLLLLLCLLPPRAVHLHLVQRRSAPDAARDRPGWVPAPRPRRLVLGPVQLCVRSWVLPGDGLSAYAALDSLVGGLKLDLVGRLAARVLNGLYWARI